MYGKVYFVQCCSLMGFRHSVPHIQSAAGPYYWMTNVTDKPVCLFQT